MEEGRYNPMASSVFVLSVPILILSAIRSLNSNVPVCVLLFSDDAPGFFAALIVFCLALLLPTLELGIRVRKHDFLSI